MNKPKLLHVLALLACMQARGQTVTPVVVASAGGHNSNAAGQIEWTLGEPVVATYATANRVTTMGFHQPELILIDALREEEKEPGILVYPNPLSQTLYLDFRGLASDQYDLALTDAGGRLILTSAFNTSEASSRCSINLPEMAAGVYLLQVKSPKTEKIIKLNITQNTH